MTRTRAVLGSLDATFRSAQVTGNEREFSSHAGAIVGAEALEKKVTELLRTAVALDRFEVIRIGSLLIVRLPLNGIFAQRTADPLPGMPALLNRLARIVGDPIPGLRNEVEIIQHPDGVPSNRAESLPMARGGVLARSLAARGIPETDLAHGLVRGDSSRWSSSSASCRPGEPHRVRPAVDRRAVMRRLGHPTSHDTSANRRWLMTFTDLTALMLVFFVLLFSMSELDTDKWRSAVAAFNLRFNVQVSDESPRPGRRERLAYPARGSDGTCPI